MPGSTALAVLVLAQLAASPPPADTPQRPAAPEAETLKERLSDKASDEQRVDNCRVPPERRGAKQRPDCAAPPAVPSASAASSAAGGMR